MVVRSPEHSKHQSFQWVESYNERKQPVRKPRTRHVQVGVPPPECEHYSMSLGLIRRASTKEVDIGVDMLAAGLLRTLSVSCNREEATGSRHMQSR